jgi:hypothetical protein
MGASLVIALGFWLPCIHFFFGDGADRIKGTGARSELSPWAKELATRQLALWEDDETREQQFDRMRVTCEEWYFMGRTYLVWALANMALADPQLQPRCLLTMDRIIEDTLQVEREQGMYHFLMPYARGASFRVEPVRSQFIDSEIALMLAHRRLVEEKREYVPLLSERVRLMTARMEQSPVLCAESYPDECWMFDNTASLAAIRMGDHLDGSDHSEFFRRWLETAKRRLIDPKTGMLVSSFTVSGDHLDGPEGSSIWMAAHFLDLVDQELARDQYARAREAMGRVVLGFAYAREWPVSWVNLADVDSGPTVPILEANAGASGLAFVGASAFDDREFLEALHASVEFAAFPVREEGGLRYCASNQVGDAVLLYAAVQGPVWAKVKGRER